MTALLYAALSGSTDMVQKLLDLGLDVNAIDDVSVCSLGPARVSWLTVLCVSVDL